MYTLREFQADLYFTGTKLKVHKDWCWVNAAYLKVTFSEGKCVPWHLIKVLLKAAIVTVRADKDDFYALVVFFQLAV